MKELLDLCSQSWLTMMGSQIRIRSKSQISLQTLSLWEESTLFSIDRIMKKASLTSVRYSLSASTDYPLHLYSNPSQNTVSTRSASPGTRTQTLIPPQETYSDILSRWMTAAKAHLETFLTRTRIHLFWISWPKDLYQDFLTDSEFRRITLMARASTQRSRRCSHVRM